ncbi:MAG TPA: calcium-binding protein [Coleofasciculaceae cyanobacterium]|jgi:Ca2+-binding RTX toxin-like protein
MPTFNSIYADSAVVTSSVLPLPTYILPTILQGTDASETLYGNYKSNNIYAQGGDDIVVGDAGTDWIDGGLGNDTLWGGTGNDSLMGNSGDDLLYGDDGNDVLMGGAGTDLLAGFEGNDILIGSSVAYGASEYDILFGGAGADTFVLGDAYGSHYTGTGFAKIQDFNYAEGDKIQVKGPISDYSVSFGGGSGNYTAFIYKNGSVTDPIAEVTGLANPNFLIPSIDFVSV